MGDRNRPILLDLSLVGDGDVHDMVRDIERAFRVDFGDRFGAWTTVADIELALLPLFPPISETGRCATTMAFYTLRRALALGREVGPKTRLASLPLGSCRGTLGGLERDLGLHMPKAASSTIGLVGMALFWFGLPGMIGLRAMTGLWWPGPVILVVGLILWGMNKGSFEDKTLGDLAREVALLNYGAFAARGADRRPETIWRVLRHIVCRQTGADPSAVSRMTGLFAGRRGGARRAEDRAAAG